MMSEASTELSRVPQTSEARAYASSRVSIAFGRRFFVGLAAGLAWLVPGWWSPRFIVAMFFWDALILAMWLLDCSRLPAPAKLFVRRVWHQRPALGVPSEVTLEVSNDGAVPVYAQVVDETPRSLSEGVREVTLVVPAHGLARASYVILPSSRGKAQVGRTFVRYQSALRLAERRATAEIQQAVRVLPNIDAARKQTLSLIHSRQAEIEQRRHRQHGMGRELESLREYHGGDEVRDISWTATARRNRLITRVFQMERSQTVWLVLDAGRLLRAQVQEPGNTLRLSKLDHAVNAALALALVAMQCGDRVGLLAYGARTQQSVNPARGSHQIRSFADALSEVHAESTEPDHARAVRTLLSVQKRRSLIVWITDFAETATVPEVIDYAMQMTPRHLVIFAAMSQPELGALAVAIPTSVDEMYRHAAALEVCQRRDGLLRRLRQRGVLAFEWKPWGLSSFLVNQYLDVKERNWL